MLLGTAILGSNSYAIFQEPSGTLRIRMGDMIDGFSLAKIREHSVVFRKGAAKVDLALQYLRKVDAPAPGPRSIARPGVPSQTGVKGQAAPRVIPQSPRRERLPAPPNA